MGFLPEATPAMGEYHVEVRSESFYLRATGRPIHLYPNPYVSVDPSVVNVVFGLAQRFDGESSARVREALREDVLDAILKAVSFGNTGTVEFMTEDIPKIRAALDQVEGSA